jgi:hypothetical protein
MDAMSHFNHGNKEEAKVLKRLMITTGKYIDGTIASDIQQILQFSKEHILNERNKIVTPQRMYEDGGHNHFPRAPQL